MDFCTVTKENKEYFEIFVPTSISLNDKNIVAIGGIEDSKFIGTIVLKIKNNNLQLLWLYVLEECRHKGYGTELFEYAATISKEIGMNSICMESMNLNEASLKFFEKMGFMLNRENEITEISVEAVKKNEKFGKIGGKAKGVKISNISDITHANEIALSRFIMRSPIGITEVLHYPDLCRECSLICMDEKDNIVACVMTTIKEKDLLIDMMVSNRGSEPLIMILIKKIYDFVVDEKNQIEKVSLLALNPKVGLLVNKLMDNQVSYVDGPVYGTLAL